MSSNYGIAFCKTALKNLNKIEDQMFAKHGHGFTKYGVEHKSELRLKNLLARFSREKELGLKPSYNPSIHGSLEE